MRQARDSKLSASDKIINFSEALKPYHLQNKLEGYYTAKMILRKFTKDFSPKEIKRLKQFAHPRPLDPIRLFTITGQRHVRAVNDRDVNQAYHTTIKLLSDSEQ